MTAAVGLHLALALLLSDGAPGRSGSERAVNVVLLDLPPVQALSSAAASDADPGGSGEPSGGSEPATKPPSEGEDEGQGRKSLADALPAPTPIPAPVGGEVQGLLYDQPGEDGDDVLLGGFVDNGYRGALLRHIRRFRLYPTEAVVRRAEGVTILRFRVTREGAVEEAWVARRSADPALDRAALETLWRAEPLPAVPGDMPAPVEVELPVPFRLPRR